MLELVTFTGVDAHTDLTELARIANEYPRAEFGVLVGSQTAGDNPIFPPIDIVCALRNLGGVNTALHLCGKDARIVAGETHTPHALNLLCQGFGRVQVNLHGDGENPERVQVRDLEIRRFAQKVDTGSVILQHRGPWSEIPIDHPRIEYLFDLSEGRGERASSTGRTRPKTGAWATPAGWVPTTSRRPWSSPRRNTRRPRSGSTWNGTSGTRTTGSTWTW